MASSSRGQRRESSSWEMETRPWVRRADRIGKDSEARETVPPSAAEAKQEEDAEAPIQQAEASPKSEYRFKDEDDDDKYLEDLLNMFRRKK